MTRRMGALLLAGVMLASLAGLVLDSAWAHGLASVLLGGYLLSQHGRLSSMALGLLSFAAITTAIALWRLDAPWPLLGEAMERFAFFATFVAALSLLRLPAYRSRLVRRCGQAMLHQSPARRYPILSLGAGLFGVILNIGVLNLFAGMIEKSNTLAAANGRQWVQKARRRRMLMALLRGFALAPLISPMGIGVAVILASMPSVLWRDLAPYAYGAALVIFLIGWLVDQLTGPHPPRRHPPSPTPSLRPLGGFCLLLLGIVLLVFTLAYLLDVRLPIATLVGAPLASWVWLAWQRRRLGTLGVIPAAVTFYRQLPWLLGPLGSEVVVLGSAGYAGHLWVALSDPQVLADSLTWLVPLGAWNAIFAMLMVLITAQVGLNPIVSVTLLAGLLPALGIPGLTPPLIGVSLMVGWALALMSSPLTASMLILSRFTGVSSWRIGYRWNGLFMLGVIPAMVAWFLLANGT
ncbi:hypothetical protein SAMN02745148_01235 [Modicisalibacter ilicicola DSM 19980]|uniref:Uncharacterized protein n=1 Tax=Modicisalibacter ilicicola DSM 19980 TaxID=1121942 RepID=A0A1M4WKL8_9GAMM|nr:hypothetical protein [Halomonas ilicicola]SHE81737.1 hypothetical protein SAMN02745148_01235 [Halomonas ilicicola DSM 19980]